MWSAPPSCGCRRRAGNPEGYTPPVQASKLITTNDVFVYDALKTPQFWLIWGVLCLNVTAGIGVLGQASAMSQEMFPGKVTAVAAAGFVGLLSLFNMLGRFFWASTVRLYRPQEHLFLLLRARHRCSTALVPLDRLDRQRRLYSCSASVVILSMYGGGFATVPAYLADMFGTPLCRRHPRLAAHRLVDGRHSRSGAGELYPRVSDRPRRAEGAGLQHHHVRHGRLVGDRLLLQLVHQGGQ